MDIQNILVLILVLLAFGYLVLKLAFPKVLAGLMGKKSSGGCGDGNCNCH